MIKYFSSMRKISENVTFLKSRVTGQETMQPICSPSPILKLPCSHMMHFLIHSEWFY